MTIPLKEAKTSPFVETFGASPLIKVIDFFLTYPAFDYSKTQVAGEVGISKITMQKVWQRLIKTEMITKTRAMGRAQLYKLNTENPRVRVLMHTALGLATAYFDKARTERVAKPVLA